MQVERVQTVSSLCATLGDIPPEFIRPEHEQPGKTTYQGDHIPELPLVDLSSMSEEQIIHVMTDASKEWGVFQVVNHGIPEEVIEELRKVGKEFFDLRQEEKEVFDRDPASGRYEGYGSQIGKDLGGKKMWSDYVFQYVWPPACIDDKFWPAVYRKANAEYTKYILPITDEIFACLSIGLGLDKQVMKEAMGGEGIRFILKVNYYPPCPRPDLALGVTPHTDMSAMGILLPDGVAGLQVFKDDRWIDAKYDPNALIIHIGDQIEILSNGKYKSVLHRSTVNKSQVRMSWVMFVQPSEEVKIGPLPQVISKENPAKYNTKKYKDYQYCKLNKLPQ